MAEDKNGSGCSGCFQGASRIVVASIVCVTILVIAAFSTCSSDSTTTTTTDTVEVPSLSDLETISWPTSGIATFLPVPDWGDEDEETGDITFTGEIALDSSDEVRIYVAIPSEDDYDDYVQDCKSAGFILSYESSIATSEDYTDYYYAEDENGYELSIRLYESESDSHYYYGFIEIIIEK